MGTRNPDRVPGFSRPKAKPPQVPRCKCGFTHHERQLWALSPGKREPGGIYCEECAPPELAAEMKKDPPPG